MGNGHVFTTLMKTLCLGGNITNWISLLNEHFNLAFHFFYLHLDYHLGKVTKADICYWCILMGLRKAFDCVPQKKVSPRKMLKKKKKKKTRKNVINCCTAKRYI